MHTRLQSWMSLTIYTQKHTLKVGKNAAYSGRSLINAGMINRLLYLTEFFFSFAKICNFFFIFWKFQYPGIPFKMNKCVTRISLGWSPGLGLNVYGPMTSTILRLVTWSDKACDLCTSILVGSSEHGFGFRPSILGFQVQLSYLFFSSAWQFEGLSMDGIILFNILWRKYFSMWVCTRFLKCN